MKGVVGGSRLGSGLMYRLKRREIYVAKFLYRCEETVWFLTSLKIEYLSHSHVNLSSGIAIW